MYRKNSLFLSFLDGDGVVGTYDYLITIKESEKSAELQMFFIFGE